MANDLSSNGWGINHKYGKKSGVVNLILNPDYSTRPPVL